MTLRRSSADSAAAFRALRDRRDRSSTVQAAVELAAPEPVAPAVDQVQAEPAAPRIRMCGLCQIRPAIKSRPGPGRCPECVAASPTKRERNRRYRGDLPRSRTVSGSELALEVRLHAESADAAPLPGVSRPRTRGECVDAPRPCPWVSCRHHLAIEVNQESGALKINHSDKETWELAHTCALDIADRGGITLEGVALALNLTRERVRQLEVRGLRQLRIGAPSLDQIAADMLGLAPALSEVPR